MSKASFSDSPESLGNRFQYGLHTIESSLFLSPRHKLKPWETEWLHDVLQHRARAKWLLGRHDAKVNYMELSQSTDTARHGGKWLRRRDDPDINYTYDPGNNATCYLRFTVTGTCGSTEIFINIS